MSRTVSVLVVPVPVRTPWKLRLPASTQTKLSPRFWSCSRMRLDPPSPIATVQITAAMDCVCRNASFILGEEVVKFEEEFAAFCEAKHCVALNSGTSALHLALLALGVKPGDEVHIDNRRFLAFCYFARHHLMEDPQFDSLSSNGSPDRHRVATFIEVEGAGGQRAGYGSAAHHEIDDLGNGEQAHQHRRSTTVVVERDHHPECAVHTGRQSGTA